MPALDVCSKHAHEVNEQNTPSVHLEILTDQIAQM